MTLLLTKKWDRSREIQQEHRKQKAPVYEEFIASLFRLFMSSKTGSPLTEDEQNAFIVKFAQGMTIWGSNDVIKKYGEFRRLSANNPDAATIAAALEDVLFSIRLDLGHPAGLRRGDLFRIFINDHENLLPGS